jgi:hypothetical protein
MFKKWDYPIHQMLQDAEVAGVKHDWYKETHPIECLKCPEDSFSLQNALIVQVLAGSIFC